MNGGLTAAEFRHWLLRRVRAWDVLPHGSSLSEEEWNSRHRVIQYLLWLHVLALPIVGVVLGEALFHSVTETALVAVFGAGAAATGLPRVHRAGLATLGLLCSSAILVHFSGGMIEMHFHFFVIVAIVTLYQSWWAFLLAIGFVAFHHAVIGTLAPADVFNHPAALDHPWKWALVHAGFIAAQSFVGLFAWRVHESAVGRERSVSKALERANADLALAQELAHLGSWDWDLVADSVWWSKELYRIMGVDPGRFQPTYDSFLELVHPDDRDQVRDLIDSSNETKGSRDYGCRIVRPDGTVRFIHAVGTVSTGEDGTALKMFGSVQDVTERRQLEEQLKHQAFHDPLTSLANRMLFKDRVQHALSRLSRSGSTLAVMFIDLDNFKDINDGMGHSAGDDVLHEVAARLKSALRAEDTAARLGGDEFAVLIEEADRDAAILIAERLLDALREPLFLEGKEILVNGSIGIAVGSGLDDVEELLRNADTAMYAAKTSGRNRYELFQQEMHAHFQKRLELQADLKRALDNDEIELHYQPVYRLNPLSIVGVEGLARWRHPEKGMISPAEFIPVAEESGLIVPLGKRVLELACRQFAHWNAVLDREHPIRCGVNFSARQLGLPNFPEEVAETLRRHNLSPEQFILEITESVLMNDPDTVAKQLAELADIGMVVAIDDFGTGFSSLSYLRRFPVRILKIDKFFIKGIEKGPEDSAYAKAIVKLGHNLGVDVVAEGIETDDELDELVAMGCDFGQGFLLARPMPASELETILQADARGLATV